MGRERRGSYLYLNINSFLFTETIHSAVRLTQRIAQSDLFHIWYLMLSRTVIKASKTNPEALNLNTVSPARSLPGFVPLLPLIRERAYQQPSAGHLQAGPRPRTGSIVKVGAARWKGNRCISRMTTCGD